jgi:hypothetical protein
MRQAGGRLSREIREVPLLRYVFGVLESHELTNYRNQVEQALGSIYTDIGGDRPPMLRDSGGRRLESPFEIPKAGRTSAFENCSLNMHIGDSQNR